MCCIVFGLVVRSSRSSSRGRHLHFHKYLRVEYHENLNKTVWENKLKIVIIQELERENRFPRTEIIFKISSNVK